jgi:hypothetical protein
MSKPKIKIHNVTTNEEIEREMNEEELAQYEANLLISELKKEQKAQAAAAKTALLEKLGITEEEAKLLLS